MKQNFSEIVIEGRFMLVKGFLLGFLSQKNPNGRYFFHRKSGIRRETFKDMLKQFFELDNYAHFCLESDLVDSFVQATELYTKVTGNEIKSVKPVHSANFNFSFEVFSEKSAQQAKEIIENMPEGVKLVDYAPYEDKDEEGRGTEAYAPLHEYTMRAKGRIEGDFAGVMDVYLKIKRSELSENIICSDVKLELE